MTEKKTHFGRQVLGGPRSAKTKHVLVNPKAFTKTCYFTAFFQCRWGCLYSKTLFKSICSTPTPTLAQHCLIVQLRMSSIFPPAALSSLPLSVRLLAPRGGSAAMVVAAVWRWRWQIGGSGSGSGGDGDIDGGNGNGQSQQSTQRRRRRRQHKSWTMGGTGGGCAVYYLLFFPLP